MGLWVLEKRKGSSAYSVPVWFNDNGEYNMPDLDGMIYFRGAMAVRELV
jgi:hypothetical protein